MTENDESSSAQNLIEKDLDKIKELIREGNFKNAILICEKYPNESNIQFQLIKIYRKCGEYEKAKLIMQKT